MDDQLMEELLNNDEGSYLDFKRDQYKFQGATDAEKSELLKDILAFANAWRSREAYILIGVEERKGARSSPVGISIHLEDANLQQFVNSKMVRPISFSYEGFVFEGKTLGVITIPVQERPASANRNYGIVKREVVYYRLGSSTAIAGPGEIAKMGAADSDASGGQPLLRVELLNPLVDDAVGLSMTIDSQVHESRESVPDFVAGGFMTQPLFNRDFYREAEQYLILTRILKPIGLYIENLGNMVAENVTVLMEFPDLEGLAVLDEADLPSKPRTSILERLHQFPALSPGISVSKHRDSTRVVAHFGKIRPKECVASSSSFYIGSAVSRELKIQAEILGDNLSQPQVVELALTIIATRLGPLSDEELDGAGAGEDGV